MNRGGAWQPYFGVKLGANYAKVRSNYNMFETRDNTWGFYVSPEIGLNVYPWAYGRVCISPFTTAMLPTRPMC